MEAENELLVEVDGEGVAPTTVDGRALLNFAAAYIDLLARLAEQRGERLAFTGLAVLDKCAAVATRPDAVGAAKESIADAERMLLRIAPHDGMGQALARLDDARAALPAGYSVSVFYGTRRREIPEQAVASAGMPWERTSIRARLVRVGGARPRARFAAAGEDEDFTLDVGHDLAQSLASHLYKLVDVEVRICRDADLRIRDGRVESFDPVPERSDDLRARMRAWMIANAPEWDTIADIEAELGRE